MLYQVLDYAASNKMKWSWRINWKGFERRRVWYCTCIKLKGLGGGGWGFVHSGADVTCSVCLCVIVPLFKALCPHLTAFFSHVRVCQPKRLHKTIYVLFSFLWTVKLCDFSDEYCSCLMSTFSKVSDQLFCSNFFFESGSYRTHLHWFLSQPSCGFPWQFLCGSLLCLYFLLNSHAISHNSVRPVHILFILRNAPPPLQNTSTGS